MLLIRKTDDGVVWGTTDFKWNITCDLSYKHLYLLKFTLLWWSIVMKNENILFTVAYRLIYVLENVFPDENIKIQLVDRFKIEVIDRIR